MNPARSTAKPRAILIFIGLTYCAMCLIGITWGLPSRDSDPYLFARSRALTGEQIASRPGATAYSDGDLGADVDQTPHDLSGDPVVVNDTPARQAEIYRRYRMFSHQPDEMVTFMALSRMNPRGLQLDPKLYQYGGLFVYPIGGLLAAASSIGAVELSGDPAAYLDRPEAFGRFYVVARLYSAVWGLIGVVIVYRIAAILCGIWSGIIAAGLYVLLPVVTCMAHEAKPHLGGAVLMLAAAMFAVQALQWQRTRDWAGLYICCGAAVGMVLSSIPILALIPLTLGMHCIQQHRRQINERTACRAMVNYKPVFVRASAGGFIVAAVVYFATNPYVAINLFANRTVLASNLGNTAAMFEFAKAHLGAIRFAQLVAEGATIPLCLLGTVATHCVMRRKSWFAPILWAPAILFAIQLTLMGAGAPDEFGRFTIFPAVALAIGSAAVIERAITHSRPIGVAIMIAILAWCGIRSAGYLHGFRADATHTGSRTVAANALAAMLDDTIDPAVAVIAEPAPYSCPPLDFAATRVVLYRSSPKQQPLDRFQDWLADVNRKGADAPPILIAAVDNPGQIVNQFKGELTETVCESDRPAWLPRGRISWADKPILILTSSATQRP